MSNAVSVHGTSLPWPKLPICPICSRSVALESGKADENGKAIHEECYLLKIGLKAATMPPSKRARSAAKIGA